MNKFDQVVAGALDIAQSKAIESKPNKKTEQKIINFKNPLLI